MKEFTMPCVEVIEFSVESVIAASGISACPNETPLPSGCRNQDG